MLRPCCLQGALAVFADRMATGNDREVLQPLHVMERTENGPWTYDLLCKLILNPKGIFTFPIYETLFSNLSGNSSLRSGTLTKHLLEALLNVDRLEFVERWLLSHPDQRQSRDREVVPSYSIVGLLPAFQGLMNEMRGSTPGSWSHMSAVCPSRCVRWSRTTMLL